MTFCAFFFAAFMGQRSDGKIVTIITPGPNAREQTFYHDQDTKRFEGEEVYSYDEYGKYLFVYIHENSRGEWTCYKMYLSCYDEEGNMTTECNGIRNPDAIIRKNMFYSKCYE